MKIILKKIAPQFVIGWYHFFLAFLAGLRYGFPSRKMIVIGVTGTNGKTTTIDLAHRILEQTGEKVASASSIKFKIGQEEKENKLKMTMPGRFYLQRFLHQALKDGCKYVLLEVTSEGVLQHRNRFIDFDAAVFTNLSPEHIERHGSFENYKKAKGKFFKQVKGLHIINMDDEATGYFLQFRAEQKIGYSIFGSASLETTKIVSAKKVQVLPKGLSFEVGQTHFELNLIGRFNVYNALAAICIGLSQGVSPGQCEQALETAGGVPGRMEEIYLGPFRAVVDYAFTPNALRQVYQTLTHQPLAHELINPSTHKLICVLGACGGGRDKWKRKVLGQIANGSCERIIITNEDPYDEDPMAIIDQVAEGCAEKALKVLDRREAINKALGLARQGDTVIITGKGCEPWICVENGKKIPWDDRRVVKEEAKKLGIALAPESEPNYQPKGQKALSPSLKRFKQYLR